MELSEFYYFVNKGSETIFRVCTGFLGGVVLDSWGGVEGVCWILILVLVGRSWGRTMRAHTPPPRWEGLGDVTAELNICQLRGRAPSKQCNFPHAHSLSCTAEEQDRGLNLHSQTLFRAKRLSFCMCCRLIFFFF